MRAGMNMSRDELLAVLESEHGIRGGEVYLLELVPLVEMVWADGTPRPAEVKLLYEFALRRMAELTGEADGVDVLSTGQVNAFLDRHLASPPDPDRLRALRRIAFALLFDHSDPAVNERRRRAIFDYCLDIGAASVGRYPYGAHERFGAPKKALMLELAESLQPAA